MKRLLAALERIATALEQLVPAVQQATRVCHISQNSITESIHHAEDENPNPWRFE